MESIKKFILAVGLLTQLTQVSFVSAMDNNISDGDEKYDAAALAQNEAIVAVEPEVVVDVTFKERESKRKALTQKQKLFFDAQLLTAVYKNDVRKARRLLNAGASCHAICQKTGNLALMVAVRFNYLDSIKLLIAYGADVNYICPLTGEGVLQEAILRKSSQAVEILLKNGALIGQVPDKGGIPILLTVVAGDDYDMLDVLMRYGADVHVTDQWGRNALMYNAMYGEKTEESRNIARRLVFAGVDIFGKVKKSQQISALDLERVEGQSIIAQALAEKNSAIEEEALLRVVRADATLQFQLPTVVRDMVFDYLTSEHQEGSDVALFAEGLRQKPDAVVAVGEPQQEEPEERSSCLSIGRCCSVFAHMARSARGMFTSVPTQIEEHAPVIEMTGREDLGSEGTVVGGIASVVEEESKEAAG